MATIYLSLSEKVDSNPQKEIRIRFKHGGKIDQQTKTNVFVPTEQWDSENQKIKIPNFRLLTAEKEELVTFLSDQQNKLDNLKKSILDLFNETDKTNIPNNWLKVEVDKFSFPEKYAPKVEKQKTVLEFIANFVNTAHTRKDKKNGMPLSYRSIQKYKTTERHLRKFAEICGKKDFEFSEIDRDFQNNFIEYLQSEITITDKKSSETKVIKKHFRTNSVGKHTEVLKFMLKEAKLERIYDIPNLQDLFPSLSEEVDNIYLNEAELQRLKDTDFSKNPSLDRVRDWFLLLCWTGSRFSDLSKITKANVKEIDGVKVISFRQQKTDRKVVIPLHKVVLEIFEKYDYNLPAEISNQKLNEYIKNACEIAELNSIESITRTVGGKRKTETFKKWQLVTSHTGRRSFCTNMYLRGHPSLEIMSISGHTTEKSFLKYIKVTQEEHAKRMAGKWAEMY